MNRFQQYRQTSNDELNEYKALFLPPELRGILEGNGGRPDCHQSRQTRGNNIEAKTRYNSELS